MSERKVTRSERVHRYFADVQSKYRDAVVQRWLLDVPDEYRSRTVSHDLIESHWDDRLSAASVKKLQRYLRNPTKFLLLKGPAGLGKSTLAATIGTELLVRGSVRDARYESIPKLLQDISYNQTETNPIGRCSYTDLLVLDDVGVASDAVTPTQRRGLWTIINERWSTTYRPTILTSNLSLTETEHGLSIGEWFGDSAWDRIKHDLTYVEFQGTSFRDE